MPQIIITSQGPPSSSAHKLLNRTSPSTSYQTHETPLLLAIKKALRGSEIAHGTSIRKSTLFKGGTADEPELIWSAHAAVLSYAGVMVKRWSFDEEGESIQWACLGELEQQAGTSPTMPSSDAEKEEGTTRPTFGPFSRHQTDAQAECGPVEPVPAAFVFLRTTCRIYLLNGVEYPCSMPFIVRRAWPILPHGVMVQRVLESSELIEAENTGEDVLPTIFTITSPFTEPVAVGLTSGILEGPPGIPASLKDEYEHSTKPLKSIPPAEMIVWASHRSFANDPNIVVTVNVEQRLLSIWRYVFIRPKTAPTSYTTSKSTMPPGSKRQSMSGRRTSALFDGGRDRIQSMSPGSRSRDTPFEHLDSSDIPSLSALPGMGPSLSTTTTMASLISGAEGMPLAAPHRPTNRGRRTSLSRNELSTTLDRMALGGRLGLESMQALPEHGRMKAAYWMESVLVREIATEDAALWRDITVSLFDNRFDGKNSRSLLSICLPASKVALIFSLAVQSDKSILITLINDTSALSTTSLRATRANVWDLLIIRPHGKISLLTHGLCEISVKVHNPLDERADISGSDLLPETGRHGAVVEASEAHWGTTTLTYEDGWESQVTFDTFPTDKLVVECFQLLALILPTELTFPIFSLFLEKWSAKAWSVAENVEFECFSSSLYTTFGVAFPDLPPSTDPWLRLANSTSHGHFTEDPVLRRLRLPPVTTPHRPLHHLVHGGNPPHPLLAPLLYGLHTLAENLRLSVPRHRDLLKLAPIVCRVAVAVRPEWADYWKRLIPDVMSEWPSSLISQPEYLDDRIPVWPPDISAILYGRVSTTDWNAPWHDVQHIVTRFSITPSLEYGVCDPLHELHKLSLLYNTLSDGKVTDSQKRAENVVHQMVTQSGGAAAWTELPLGIAAPLREAARTCQLAPPGNWPLDAYRLIGRNDLATSATVNPDAFISKGYKSKKEYINPSKPQQTIGEITAESRTMANEAEAPTGVDLNLKEFTDIRFGLDRRLEEVARMLCSSTIPSIKGLDRPDLSEHDQTKEHQNQVVRVAERTFALPYGRAMFTFGSVPIVTQEAYSLPKMEYNIRVQPLNILVTPEPGKIAGESIAWGDFHNGVAAGLRIAPAAPGVESSWIAFNKPTELSAEHAGFLLALGLTGHLRSMMTWHMFSYLTPKHDYTTIALLIGMSAAHVGSGNENVIKLIAVHTPALLPTPKVDLNLSLLTQAAGLVGVGLIFLGTRNRRMAEVCLGQIGRRDLTQHSASTEHREAHTYASALSFGLIMLGKGTTIPADLAILKRLSVLIHRDDSDAMQEHRSNPLFDINLTSPAASIALGLMYLKTGRKDVANILTIPDTIVSLNAVQPTFLLIRTIARSLIMWDEVAPNNEWLIRQIPKTIIDAIEVRTKTGKAIDDAMELAYYNIIAGGCFAVGLKYAGTARQEAYQMIVKHFDNFSRMAYGSGPAFDHKIKRSAIRDGLNLISLSLSMVMAGTGEITCLRRLRYAYGMSQQLMYHHGFKYGVHVATHQSLGLLFLGGGRFTLGTSDAAIACMVIAFFPRFSHISSDNRSFMQPLRHLWVLATEPRCLIARDVDTNEVVFLPVKITMKEGNTVEQTQLISPTLIPDMDKLMAIRVDTPRYWPFYLDTTAHPRHKITLLRSQTLYVKRRTAFLSYTEDPRGSRSLFIRSGSSTGDAATLDFPQLTDTKTHPAGDLSEFITSFSNNVLFLAFADHFSRADDEDPTDEERIFHTYCHAALLDSIHQDKPQTLQSHLTLYSYRTMSVKSRYFHLRLQDLRFAADFYAKVYERRFSGRLENNARPGLIRDTTVQGTLHALDRKLDAMRALPTFQEYVGRYARGEILPALGVTDIPISVDAYGDVVDEELLQRYLAWYLLRNGVPVSTLLVVLRQLAQDAHNQCINLPPPLGTSNAQALDMGIKEVLHSSGNKMTTALGSGWSVRSLNEILDAWKLV